jgi:hypothetical protein
MTTAMTIIIEATMTMDIHRTDNTLAKEGHLIAVTTVAFTKKKYPGATRGRAGTMRLRVDKVMEVIQTVKKKNRVFFSTQAGDSETPGTISAGMMTRVTAFIGVIIQMKDIVILELIQGVRIIRALTMESAAPRRSIRKVDTIPLARKIMVAEVGVVVITAMTITIRIMKILTVYLLSMMKIMKEIIGAKIIITQTTAKEPVSVPGIHIMAMKTIGPTGGIQKDHEKTSSRLHTIIGQMVIHR